VSGADWSISCEERFDHISRSGGFPHSQHLKVALTGDVGACKECDVFFVSFVLVA